MVSMDLQIDALVGRAVELQRLCQILRADQDVVIAGVPGIGRHQLLRSAARLVGAVVVEIDCLRSTNYQRFLHLLGEAILRAFSTDRAIDCMEAWAVDQPLRLDRSGAKLQWHWRAGEEWELLRSLVSLPQVLAEVLGCRVVVVFQNFPHMASWDRQGRWQDYLQAEIRRQADVSYVLIETAVVDGGKLPCLALGPLEERALQAWLGERLRGDGWGVTEAAMALFLSYAQGHFADAMALVRRLGRGEGRSLEPQQVKSAAFGLVEDLAVTFESLILLLPNTQVRVLESLALDPTPQPHAGEYIRKHHLSRGGTLQGALASLEQKGLLYGAAHGYRIALPMLALWLKQRLL
jgi:hypothetical protein